MTEINTLRILNTHVNVVKLIGFSIKTIPYLMVMELVASGDLKSYLIDLREEWQKNRSNRNKYEYVIIISHFLFSSYYYVLLRIYIFVLKGNVYIQ